MVKLLNGLTIKCVGEKKKGKFTKIYSAYKPFPEARELWPLLGQSLGEFYAIGCNYIGMDGLYDAGKLFK